MGANTEFDLDCWSLENLSQLMFGEPFDADLLERRLAIDRRRQRLNPRPYLKLVVDNAECSP